MKPRRLFIITGISGAGKSQALKCFEDFGFFCVDNLPMALIDEFSDLLLRSRGLKAVALGIDIREGEFLKSFAEAMTKLRGKGFDCRIIFLESSDEVVIRRFSETRHRHPLGKNITDSIRQERKHLTEIKGMADKIIDTSDLTLGELKEKLSSALELKHTQEMNLSVVSFGYKYGIPRDADIVMDVRFLPNPNYRPRFKHKTGLSPGVQKYILRQPGCREFLRSYTNLVHSLLPHYIHEGKSYLTLAFGCTGGQHRSVFVANYLAAVLQKSGYTAIEYHRDINR